MESQYKHTSTLPSRLSFVLDSHTTQINSENLKNAWDMSKMLYISQ